MNIQKLYSLLQTNTNTKKKEKKKKKKRNPIKEQVTSKLCPTIFNGIKIETQKCEQKNLKYPYAYQYTQWQKKETKIILMVK